MPPQNSVKAAAYPHSKYPRVMPKYDIALPICVRLVAPDNSLLYPKRRNIVPILMRINVSPSCCSRVESYLVHAIIFLNIKNPFF